MAIRTKSVHLPELSTDNRDLELAFRAAVGDLVGNFQWWKDLRGQERYCLQAGLHYDHPWTRDAAINSWNGLSLMWPEIAADTLRSVLCEDEHGLRIGGQYWDSIIWSTAAWNHYLVTGDREFLSEARRATDNSLRFLIATEFDADDGLFRGGGCFFDGISAYPDHYRKPDDWGFDIETWPKRYPERRHPVGAGFPGKTLSTNCLYLMGFRAAVAMANALGEAAVAEWAPRAEALREAIGRRFQVPGKSSMYYLLDPWGNHGYQEGLGLCFAVMSNAVDGEQREKLLANAYRTPQGLPCLWPPYERYTSIGPGEFGGQSGTIWPQVNAFWAEVCVQNGLRNEAARDLSLLAARVVRDGHFAEVYHPITGERYHPKQEALSIKGMKTWRSQQRQSWCATGLVRMILTTCFGWKVGEAGLTLDPWLPEGIGRLHLSGLHFCGKPLDLRLERQADGTLVLERNGKSERL
jgi:glycogen debranching enzyme